MAALLPPAIAAFVHPCTAEGGNAKELPGAILAAGRFWCSFRPFWTETT